jgi:hypothetical protein
MTFLGADRVSVVFIACFCLLLGFADTKMIAGFGAKLQLQQKELNPISLEIQETQPALDGVLTKKQMVMDWLKKLEATIKKAWDTELEKLYDMT